MKKILLALVMTFLLFIGLSTLNAEAATKDIIFTWEQTSPTDPMIKEWKILQSSLPGGPYTQAFFVPFDGVVKPEYTSGEQDLIVPDNTLTTLYFVAVAAGVNGQQSGYSNEVRVDLDFRLPGIPIRFKATVKTQ